MVSTNVIEIILRAKDEASKAAKQAEESLRKAGKTAADSFYEGQKAGTAFEKAIEKAGNTAKNMSSKFNGLSDAIKSQLEKAQQKVKSFADEFMNAHPKIKNTAETIKTQLSTAMEKVKSKVGEVAKNTGLETLATKSSNAFQKMGDKASSVFSSVKEGLNSLSSKIPSIKFKGDTTEFDHSRQHVYESIQELSRMNVDPFAHISTAGLMTLDGEVAQVSSKFDTLKQKASTAFDSIKQKGQNAMSSIKQKVENLGDAFSGLNGIMAGAMGAAGLGSFKSLTIDLAMSREQMTALMGATMGSTQAAKEFVDQMRQGTQNSPVQLRMMINAMNGIKLSTGMTNDELKSLDGIIRRVGEASLLMGDDTEHATFVMKEAMSGLNGDFTVLKEQFGITADKMKEMGWDGTAEDVEGYRIALEKCMEGMGDLEGVMDTTPGKISKIKSSFNSAGLKIGEEFLPYIDKACDIFLDANENGNVLSTTILQLGGAFSLLSGILPTIKPVIDTMRSIKDVAKDVYDTYKKVNDVLKTFELRQKLATIATTAHNLVLKVWQGITKVATAIQAAFNLVMSLNPIYLVVIAIVALIAVLGYLYFNNEQVRNTINALGEYIQGTLIEAWNQLTTAVWNVWNAIVAFGTAIWNLPGQIYEALTGLLEYIWNWAVSVYDSFVNSASNAVTGFVNWIMSLPGMVWTWLWNTITNFINWGGQVKDQTVNAGRNAVNGFVDWIKSLPGKVWTWLWNTILKVIDFALHFGDNAKKAAKEAVDKFKEKLKLKKIVQDELNYIGDCLKNAVGWLADKARELARNIWNAFKGETDQHSPGRIARVIIDEVGYIDEAFTENNDGLADKARETARSIIDGFQNNDFSSMEQSVTPNVSMETPATPTMSVNPQLVTTDTQSITESMASMNQQVGLQLNAMSNNIMQLGTTSTENMNLLLQNNATIILGYSNLANNIQQTLQNIQVITTQQWNTIKTTTEKDLKSILNSTNDVTKQMINAWKTMKDSIVQAADNIKNESTNRFNSLWSTIKTFYHNIQHPGGAGPSSGGHIRRAGTGFSSLGSALRTGLSSALKPAQNRYTSVDLSNMGIPTNAISYLTGTSTGATVKADDVMKFLQRGGAGWDSAVKPNTKFIKDKSNAWSVAGPVILGKYATGLDIFKVKDFENGTPTISFETFKKMAEAVFSQCHYLFYMDSDMYGNWQTAARNGNMNCSDSTDFLIELANACGLGGSKIHGYWNNIGHFWANIAGHKMDTTGWMLHRTWTPAQSHSGPRPGYEETYLEDNSFTVNHDGTVTLRVECDFQGNVPENLDEEEVAQLLLKLLNERKTLKALTSNSIFQELDNKYKERIKGQLARFS